MFGTLRKRYGTAIAGFAVTVLFVAYQSLLFDFRVPLSNSRKVMTVAFTILCPPALLSIPIIDAEVGTSGFYFLWTIIGLLNAVLYAGLGALIGSMRKKSR